MNAPGASGVIRPTLDDNFALVRDLHAAGLGVELLLSPEPNAAAAVTVLMRASDAKRLTAFPWWERLMAVAERHGVEPYPTDNGIEFKERSW